MMSTTIKSSYLTLLKALDGRQSVIETNKRTKVKIKVLEGAHSFKFDLSDGRLPVPGNRKYWPHIAAAETAWQLMGTQDPAWILKNAPKIWKDFVEDGKIKAAYGYRWRKWFGRDQLQLAINELCVNPTNRQLYISAWDPAEDGLGEINQPKNLPCPVGFCVNRVDNKIHMSVFLRSSDVFVGLPYDIMGYALTLDAIASSVPDCAPGTLHFTLAHAHVYEPHWEFLYQSVRDAPDSWTKNVQPQLPAWTVEDILVRSEAYLEHVKRLSARVNSNSWSPLPKLVL